MAPYPENDKAPKAPDKNTEKSKVSCGRTTESRQQPTSKSATENDTKEASVSDLDDENLRALLNEAITYKNPKDREGKSDLFRNLLDKAEDDLRKIRATSASGSEQVRHHNTTATRRNRHKRQQSSISENLAHGGSLNNLAKEELYESVSHLQRSMKTVSARQREGGSLPCNVNIPGLYDRQSFEETYGKKENEKKEYTTIDMGEQSPLLEHDALNQNFSEDMEIDETPVMVTPTPKNYTTSASLQISNVDDCVTVPAFERCDKNTDIEPYKCIQDLSGAPKYSLLVPGPWPFFSKAPEDKKVDENGNALGHSSDVKKNKKKKRENDKNVVVLEAENVVGHRSDIINDVKKLIDFIDGNENQTGTKPKSNVRKSKLHKHVSTEEKSGTKKNRNRSKAKSGTLQKSTSMEEMSTSKLEDFDFSQDKESKVTLRPTKSNVERPSRERRSWGNPEPLQLQNIQLYANNSAENFETADFRVVTKKKKSKKRRNSLSGRTKPYFGRESENCDYNGHPSRELRKSACSVPHSEKSNDSSDVDSVHSLPIDTNRLERESLNVPISYAEIAKNNTVERPKWNRPPSERKKMENLKKNPDKPNVKTEETFEHIVNKSAHHELEPLKIDVQESSPVKPKVVTQAVQTSPKATAPFTEKLPSPVPNTAAITNAQPVLKTTDETKNTVENKLIIDNNYNQNFPSIQNHRHHNSPVGNQGLTNSKEKVSSSNKQLMNNANKIYKNNLNNFKNIKNAQNIVDEKQKVQEIENSMLPIMNNMNAHMQQVIHNNEQQVYNFQHHPPNITDVHTIEKLQLKAQQFRQLYPQSNNLDVSQIMNHVQNLKNSVQTQQQQQVTSEHDKTCTPLDNNVNNDVQSAPLIDNRSVVENCDSERTTSCMRPAVVILSGDDSKEISGITFGFDINEQLLSDDVCNDFIARFVVPELPNNNGYNHDKIVNFIGSVWEEVIKECGTKAKYYNEEL